MKPLGILNGQVCYHHFSVNGDQQDIRKKVLPAEISQIQQTFGVLADDGAHIFSPNGTQFFKSAFKG